MAHSTKKFGKLAKTEAHEEGVYHRSQGWGKYDNPHSRGTPAYVEWLRGWNEQEE